MNRAAQGGGEGGEHAGRRRRSREEELPEGGPSGPASRLLVPCEPRG